MAARSWMALAVMLALASSALAESQMGRRLLKKKKENGGTTVIANNCAELKKAVDAFATKAIANAKAIKLTKNAKKNRKRVAKKLLHATVVLACGGTFECTDASAAEGKRDYAIKMSGAGKLTVKAADACASGDARPKVGGGLDTFPTELFYVGAANPSNAADKGGVAYLKLQNIILNGAVKRADTGATEKLRTGVLAVRAGGVELENVDFVDNQGKSAYGGGAIYAEDAPLEMNGGKITGAVTASNGAAIWAETTDGGDFLVVKGVTISDCKSASGSGVIALTKTGAAAAKATLTGNTISGNTAAKCAVLFTDRSDVAAGATKAEDAAGAPLAVDLTGSTISGNSAANGLTYCGTAVKPFTNTELAGVSRGAATAAYNDFAS